MERERGFEPPTSTLASLSKVLWSLSLKDLWPALSGTERQKSALSAPYTHPEEDHDAQLDQVQNGLNFSPITTDCIERIYGNFPTGQNG